MPLADVDQRGERGRSFSVRAMTACAVVVIERCGVVCDHADDPRLLVGVDVQQASSRIKRRTAPFAAAIGAWHARWREPSVGIELAKPSQNGGVRFGSAIRHHVLGEFLTGERRRLYRIGLGSREFLSIERRRRNFAISDREQWLASTPAKKVHVAGLSDLRDGLHLAAI